jgi:hypothetical protein
MTAGRSGWLVAMVVAFWTVALLGRIVGVPTDEVGREDLVDDIRVPLVVDRVETGSYLLVVFGRRHGTHPPSLASGTLTMALRARTVEPTPAG